MRVVIVGAGIGGLVAALSLHAAGHRDIRVVERVRELRPLGVGNDRSSLSVDVSSSVGAATGEGA